MAVAAGFATEGVAHIASRARPAIQLPAEVVSQLQAGDLIFRIGSGWQSDVVRGMARDRQAQRGDPYSHVGMLIGSPAHWQVLHAVPAEMPGRPDAVVRDELDFFLGAERAHGVAIYRVAADVAARNAAISHALERLGTPFRIVEDDREGQYCTTLVWRAWQRAGVDLGARFEHLDIPLAAGDYLLPHSLRAAQGLRLVFEMPVQK
jgi:hypothetical protein